MQKFSSAHAFAVFGLNEAAHREKVSFTTGMMSNLAAFLGRKATGLNALKNIAEAGGKARTAKALGAGALGTGGMSNLAQWGAKSGTNAALLGGGATALGGLGMYGVGDALHTGRRERRRQELGV